MITEKPTISKEVVAMAEALTIIGNHGSKPLENS